MRGLTDTERDVLLLVIEEAGVECASLSDDDYEIQPDWPEAWEKAADDLVEQGRITEIECVKCIAAHHQPTAAGRDALWADTAARAILPP